jgi:hypothetical protein
MIRPKGPGGSTPGLHGEYKKDASPEGIPLFRRRFIPQLISLLCVLIVAGWFALSHRGAWTSRDDELLVQFAEIGRAGTAVLCDPSALKQKLKLQTRDTDSLNAGASVAEFLSTDAPIGGSFLRTEKLGATVCRLQLRFIDRPICDVRSARVERLLGSRLQLRPAMIGRSGYYDHGHAFSGPGAERSLIGWWVSDSGCSSHVELVGTSN